MITAPFAGSATHPSRTAILLDDGRLLIAYLTGNKEGRPIGADAFYLAETESVWPDCRNWDLIDETGKTRHVSTGEPWDCDCKAGKFSRKSGKCRHVLSIEAILAAGGLPK